MCTDCVYWDVINKRRICGFNFQEMYNNGSCEYALPAVDPNPIFSKMVFRIINDDGVWIWKIKGTCGLSDVDMPEMKIRQVVYAPYDDAFNCFGQYN